MNTEELLKNPEIAAQVNQQLSVLTRGVEAIYNEKDLTGKLAKSIATGVPLRVKLGMDPTAPDIHLGHSVILRKLRQFQDFGHKAVLIIGDFTAMVGDPSGRSKTRPVLDRAAIEANAQTYFKQVGQILKSEPELLEVRHNSSWLADMRFDSVLKLAGQMTVGQMLKREDFRKRFESETPIGVHEFMYPLMQGYDSVMIESDVELGGTDQTFNNLVGRDLQLSAGQSPQVVIVMPILVGLDGANKMSKSLGNYIGLTDEPKLMFERVMSISDETMKMYFTLLTDFDAAKIAELTDAQRTHPKQAKMALGQFIVRAYHSDALATWAAEEFDRVHAKRELPEDLPQIAISADATTIAKLLVTTALVASSGEGKRMVQQGGVRINGEAISDANAAITPTDGMIVQVGRRKFARLKVS